MAFYILHDSFIRPTLSHSVLKTRNENIFRESKNIVKISTKTEKRKRDIVRKENVSINEDIHKNKQVNIKYAKEEFSQQEVENLASFESDLSEEYGSASVFTEELEEHGSENFLIFHFPLDERAVPPQSCKCHQLVIKHPEKLKLKPREVEKNVHSHSISKMRFFKFPAEEEVLYPLMDSCSISELEDNAKKEFKIATNQNFLHYFEIGENIKLELSDDLQVQETQFMKVDPKIVAQFLHEVENEVVLDTHLCLIPNNEPKILEKSSNKAEIQWNICRNDLKDAFIHNDLKNKDILHDDSDSDDELPNLEFVDKNSLMQQDLLKRNDSDCQQFYRAVKNEDNLIIRGCDANKLKKIEKLSYKPAKARSRYVSPRNKKDRTIEKEYNMYQKVLVKEKMKKKENNLKDVPTKPNQNIKYRETNINISLSCESAGSSY